MEKLAKVLLVDDDSTTNYLNSLLLSRLSVTEQLLVAQNGLEALQKLDQMCSGPAASTGPMLVLLDVNMPVMNGLDFLKTYQQHPRKQDCPLVIVMLTTSQHSQDLERIKSLAIAVDIISKPLTREKITTILQRYFQRSLPA
jgi:CheY-like chemotaxis protein